MAVRRYRGCKHRRKRHLGEMPVPDAPLERDEIIRMNNGQASQLLDEYVYKAEAGLEARAEKKLRVWQLWTAGRTPHKIAELLGMTPDAVTKQLKLWREEFDRGLHALPVVAAAELILHYQNIYHESIEAWHRSCREMSRNRMNRRNRTTTGENANTVDETNTEIIRSPRDGDPRFLERAQAALDRLAVLQGLAPPGSLAAARQVQNLQASEAATTTAPAAQVQIYLPHNGRDELGDHTVEAPVIPVAVNPETN